MPGKSKHKKFKQYPNKRPGDAQASPSTTAPPTISSSLAPSKPLAPPSKSSGTGKQAGAQYTLEQFKYVGTELKVAGSLAAVLLIIIIVLYFVLH
jgi:hypothetical protein